MSIIAHCESDMLPTVILLFLPGNLSFTFYEDGLSIPKNELAENSQLKTHNFSGDGENVLQHNIDFQR